MAEADVKRATDAIDSLRRILVSMNAEIASVEARAERLKKDRADITAAIDSMLAEFLVPVLPEK